MDGLDFDFGDAPQVVRVKPDDQLELSPEALEKEVPPRVLYPNDPRAAHNVSQYSWKEKYFKVDDQVEHTVVHFAMDGALLLKESEEAQEQEEMAARKAEEKAKVEAAEAVDVEIEQYPGEEAKSNTLKNQFHFSERGAQTLNSLIRERGCGTEPPPTTNHCETVTQWEIFDSYMTEIKAAKERSGTGPKKRMDMEILDQKKNEADPLYSDSMRNAIKVMERMVYQNADSEIYFDFKFWEDKSDAFRDGEGTLLPLWRFSTEKAKRKQVTAIKWNKRYSDLFAVAFGSYDFLKQGAGLIAVYSLKNSRFPEYIFPVEAGVCCLDWHPENPALLAVGCYDGIGATGLDGATVAHLTPDQKVHVYDVRSRQRKPVYSSTVRTAKHTDPVWEVCWNTDDVGGVLSFYSISSDGRVSLWKLMKNKLESEEFMELKLASGGPATQEDDDGMMVGLAGGLCFDFSKGPDRLLLIGTEEGKIHKCSLSFAGQYLTTYEGHTMAVYTVRWNSFHPRIFISSSADWTVKIWDHASRHCIMNFDLGQAVGDVGWAPYSSTVVCAITADGIVHIYDLSINRHDRICYQKVVKKSKLTHLGFNHSEPVLLVGDDRGGVSCLKLSPNLRLKTVVDEEETRTQEELELEKMEALLEMVQEK